MLRNTSTNGWFIGRGEDEESERRNKMKSDFREFRLYCRLGIIFMLLFLTVASSLIKKKMPVSTFMVFVLFIICSFLQDHSNGIIEVMNKKVNNGKNIYK